MDIKIFTTPTWPYCHQAKEFLTQQGVLYEEKDVVSDAQAREEMIKLSGRMAVPVIVIDGEVMVGFDQKGIETKLKALPRDTGN